MKGQTKHVAALHDILGIEQKAFNAAMTVLAELNDMDRATLLAVASLSSEDRQMLIDYWKNLWGPEYARDEVKDYVPRGEKMKVASEITDGIKTLAALSSEDRNLIRDYWKNLRGKEYAKDMVENYTPDGESIKVKASGIDPKTARALLALDEDAILRFAQMYDSDLEFGSHDYNEGPFLDEYRREDAAKMFNEGLEDGRKGRKPNPPSPQDLEGGLADSYNDGYEQGVFERQNRTKGHYPYSTQRR